MDKKNTAIGVLLLLAAFGSFYYSSRFAPPVPPAPSASSSSGSTVARNEAPPPGPASSPSDAILSAPKPVADAPADYVTLANDYLVVKFTSLGGAIDSIGLKKHRAELGKPGLYTLNSAQAAPALSLADFPGGDRATAYALVSQTATEVVYRTVSDGLEITRRYSLAKAPGLDDYQIRHETVFRNLTDKLRPLPRAAFNVGTAAPLNENDLGIYLNAGYSDGNDATFVARSSLEGGGFFSSSPPPPFIDRPATVAWASVKNQFFTLILTPDEPGTGVRVQRVKLDPLAPDTDRKAYGITSYAQFDIKPLAPGGSVTFGANYYAGPKEYKRLSNVDIFKHGEDKVMQFNTGIGKIFFSGIFAPLLLTMMTAIHSVVPNWGWAIILTTLTLKTLSLPFTLAASRSSKRMAKLNPLMQAMREKYKDNPQKVQSETLKLFKEHKVNPVGGCIPILITMPFFIGFFSMLQSASDLRFASFLWIRDLSAADTVYSFGVANLPLLGLTHLNLNIMPLFLGATTIVSMRMMPTPPTADNAQATMMKIMPWMFTLFCYNFASGLALYSTINGLFTIGQQMIINRMPDPQLTATPGTGPATGSMKNVTPAKKREK